MLQGLGEPFKQLREFVKDLWFRNQQERRHGELDLLERELELEAKYGPRWGPKHGHTAAGSVELRYQLPSHAKQHELPRGES